jgi:hypothetical protein
LPRRRPHWGVTVVSPVSIGLAAALCAGAGFPAQPAERAGHTPLDRTTSRPDAAAAPAHTHVRARPRISAADLLQGRDVTSSFEALRQVLEPGYEVVVTDTSGRSRRGRLASISGDRLVLASPVAAGAWEAVLPMLPPFLWSVDVGVMLKRRLFPASDQTFSEASVKRIDIVDPAGNGAAIGGAVGIALATGVYLWERRQPAGSLKGLATTLAVVWGIPISFRVGHVVDRAINSPIYERPGSTARVTIAPWIGHGAIGVMVYVR